METKLCDERHKNIDETFVRAFDKMSILEKVVYGNGKDGLSGKVATLYAWYQKQTATQAGLLDWAFRVLIMIVLTFIAVKVGLK